MKTLVFISPLFQSSQEALQWLEMRPVEDSRDQAYTSLKQARNCPVCNNEHPEFNAQYDLHCLACGFEETQCEHNPRFDETTCSYWCTICGNRC
jgi:hypothetical protein